MATSEYSNSAELDAGNEPSSAATSIISSAELSDGSALDGGEMEILLESLEEPSAPLAPSVASELKRSLSGLLSSTSGDSYYGVPLSPEEAELRVAEGDEGMKWHALVVPDAFFSDGKLHRDLNKRDFDAEKQEIKPRRPSLPITTSDLFQSLTKVEGENGPRYVFHGVLNGWPALRCFELVKLDQKQQSSIIYYPRDLLTGKTTWNRVWKSNVEGLQGINPSIPDLTRVYRATLRAPDWTIRGWSKNSPGFAWWYEPHRPSKESHLTYGTNMLTQLGDDSNCSHIHMFSHRYAVRYESPKDLMTYHSVCLLEWEHGKYMTVVECAYLNGISGYNGRSNWCADRDIGTSALYKAIPPEMVCPWRMTSAEIRCLDIPFTKLDEFKEFVAKYEGNDQRFVDPKFSFNHPARLTFRSKKHIAQYLLNYIQRDSSYADLRRNCQTFAADFCAFIAGKKNIVPFHPVARIEYQNRTYLFLYDSSMYESRQEKKKKQLKKKEIM